MEEEDVTLEDILGSLLYRVSMLEDAVGDIAEAQENLGLDHSALFHCMRSTGRFSKDMFKRIRAAMVREQPEENEEEVED
jgi:hypothetical protein